MSLADSVCLAIAIVLALWLEISAAIILLGGELVALLTRFPLTADTARS